MAVSFIPGARIGGPDFAAKWLAQLKFAACGPAGLHRWRFGMHEGSGKASAGGFPAHRREAGMPGLVVCIS